MSDLTNHVWVHDEANFVARDLSGDVYEYTNKPDRDLINNIWEVIVVAEICKDLWLINDGIEDSNWQNSLQFRQPRRSEVKVFLEKFKKQSVEIKAPFELQNPSAKCPDVDTMCLLSYGHQTLGQATPVTVMYRSDPICVLQSDEGETTTVEPSDNAVFSDFVTDKDRVIAAANIVLNEKHTTRIERNLMNERLRKLYEAGALIKPITTN